MDFDSFLTFSSGELTTSPASSCPSTPPDGLTSSLHCGSAALLVANSSLPSFEEIAQLPPGIRTSWHAHFVGMLRDLQSRRALYLHTITLPNTTPQIYFEQWDLFRKCYDSALEFEIRLAKTEETWTSAERPFPWYSAARFAKRRRQQVTGLRYDLGALVSRRLQGIQDLVVDCLAELEMLHHPVQRRALLSELSVALSRRDRARQVVIDYEVIRRRHEEEARVEWQALRALR